MHLLYETIGWLGAVLLLSAYGLNALGRIEASSRTYQLMNIGGSICFIINTFYHNAIPSLVVNVIWAAIGIFAAMQQKPTKPENVLDS